MITTIDHGPVRELRLSRPPVNALSPELIAALGAAVAAAPEEGARALVLSGSPGMFSGGLDVPVLLPLEHSAIRDTWEALYRVMHGLAASPVPVVAAITGHSPAGGAVLSLFCDYRVMTEGNFKIGLNEVAVGIPLPMRDEFLPRGMGCSPGACRRRKRCRPCRQSRGCGNSRVGEW